MAGHPWRGGRRLFFQERRSPAGALGRGSCRELHGRRGRGAGQWASSMHGAVDGGSFLHCCGDYMHQVSQGSRGFRKKRKNHTKYHTILFYSESKASGEGRGPGFRDHDALASEPPRSEAQPSWSQAAQPLNQGRPFTPAKAAARWQT